MRNKRSIIHILIAIVFASLAMGCKENVTEIMALTGATPLAYMKNVPAGLTLSVNGQVKKDYEFSASALRALATTTVRTREVSRDGKFFGTYAYTGIPVIHLLEGIAPAEPKKGEFDRPLDMVVTFSSKSGKSASFSYGELTMADDAFPVILAYDRREILPTEKKTKEAYTHNVYRENLKGFRIICPGDTTNARYLDDVSVMTLGRLTVSLEGTPGMTKGSKCGSDAITCMKDGVSAPGAFAGIPRMKVGGWVKMGHGRGYKGISTVQGFSLPEFLKRNFPGCGPDDYFMFIGCDGYRSIFSGMEIFEHVYGDSMIIMDRVDGKGPQGGLTLGPMKDYFIDRCVRGLTHVVIIEQTK